MGLESRSSCSKTHLPATTSPHLSLGPNLSVPEDEDSRRAHLSNLSRIQAWISGMVVEGVASWCHFQLWFNIHDGSFPGGSDSKQPVCNAGDPGLIPGWGRSPGEGNGDPLQCSCLENSMNRGAWRATDHGWQRVGHH